MDCAVMQPELIAYHFGELEDPARARLEAHLLSCPGCLRDFLALKRALETSELTPSAAAKARLREAVVRSIAQPRIGWSWWERPVAVGFAVAAVTVATFATVSLAASPGAAPHGWVASAPR